ncbi:hypothetical protein HMPREF3188_01489 [Tissierellia bacterium KA00581]|nr:hypothetical protein HMPREF3188_01489 [Tissierellia bacterium KA00581]
MKKLIINKIYFKNLTISKINFTNIIVYDIIYMIFNLGGKV